MKETRKIFVMVPSLIATGPIKGAVALCKGLAEYSSLSVTLVSLKKPASNHVISCEGVDVLSLSQYQSWKEKYKIYREVLRKEGGREFVVSISFCLSADLFNSFMSASAIIYSSVRGNLFRNYRFEYGVLGALIAFMHYASFRRFDRVIAMSESMACQLRKLGLRRLSIVRNFVDEPALGSIAREKQQNVKTVRFVFLGSLSSRKRPDLVVQALRELTKRDVDCHLDIVGDGSMRLELENTVRSMGLKKIVTFHGQVNSPYQLLQSADCMVLPSESEGISRAALEALYFGVPCIMRDVDANRDLINSEQQGLLFRRDEELADVMACAAERWSDNSGRKDCSLLPAAFRQKINVQRYVELVSR